MKTIALAMLLYFAPSVLSRAAEPWDPRSDRLNLPHEFLSARPDEVLRLEKSKGRKPASVDNAEAKRQALIDANDRKLKIGALAIIQGSVPEWNNEVVQVVALYENGDRKVQLENGKFAHIRLANLNTLSPEKKGCCDSNGVKVCKGDKVYHPLPSSSIAIPEGKVQRLFENCSVVVRDGLDFVYDARQLGKPVQCSPQKPSVCVDKTVFAEGYKQGNRFSFEAPVAKVYTNGTALLRTDLFLMPIDVTALSVQTESTLKGRRPASVVVGRDSPANIPTYTTREVEPADATLWDKSQGERGAVQPFVMPSP